MLASSPLIPMPDYSAIRTSFYYASAIWADPNFARHPAVVDSRAIAQALQPFHPSFRFDPDNHYFNIRPLRLLPMPGSHGPIDMEYIAQAWARLPTPPAILIKMVTNGVTVVGVSPITVILNNMAMNKSRYPAMSYFDLLRKMLTPFAGTLPGFNGYAPFTKRMAFIAMFGFTSTDFIANQALTCLPYTAQPFVAGLASSSLLAIFASRTMLQELRAQLPVIKITFPQLVALMAVRDSFSLTGGQLNMRYSREYNLSPSQTFLAGLISGMSAGVVSMPFQNIIAKTAKSGSFTTSVLEIYQSGIFSGSAMRAAIVGIHTGALVVTNRLVDWYRNPSTSAPPH